MDTQKVSKATCLKVLNTRVVSEKFKVQEVVFEVGDKYPSPIIFQITNEQIDEFNIQEGKAYYDICYNLGGREWTAPDGQVKYFTSLKIWSISDQPKGEALSGIEANFQEDAIADLPKQDDLPF